MNPLRREMTLPSHLRYLLWRLGVLGKEVTVQLTSGQRLLLSGLWMEVDTACEVLITEGYRCPRPIESHSIRRIVDVGAYVGFSILYWAAHFPDAKIETFEPHPVHLDRLRRTIALNHLTDSVTVYEAAAGTVNRRAELTNHSVASAVLANGSASEVAKDGVLPINIVDFFEVVGDERIDLLKLDCEGGEFDLLMDKRFDRLDIRSLVMEWHETAAHSSAEQDISSRLLELGWELQPGPITVPTQGEGGILRAGIMWAFPPSYQQ
jgi:FkbM family methyltransferase